MKYETAAILIAFFGLSATAPTKREVPQEHSHNAILASVNAQLKVAGGNPAKIQDAVFGLLGDKAAAAGAGSITDLACLHQATADAAFTTAKAAGDVQSQVDALVYAALERNTGSVGLASAVCTSFTPVNAEVAALSQHQDPAGAGAQAANKALTLTLAKQIQSIGGNPQDALKAGTFAPGKIGDSTGAGNTCDVADDTAGCIFSQNLIVNDATAAEIEAAVASVAAAATTAGATAAAAANGTAAACPASSANSTAAAAAAVTAAAAVASNNVQTFTGALGGAAPAVINTVGSDRPFSVNGNTFVGEGAALQRSCSIQQNACSNAANSGALNASSSDCQAQEQACNAAAAAPAAKRAALDFGTCSNPAIEFAVGLDGRKEASFQAVDQSDFNHGSALKIGVIASFVCQQLDSKCKAGADALAACATAQTAAGAASGQASADAFNSALGVSAGAAAGNATAAAGDATAAAGNATAAAVATNVQTFTGTLGGAAPPVTDTVGSDRPFSVNGATFVNKGAALQRSCAVQNTACSNAVNSGTLAGSNVGDCNAQEAACNAAAA